mmetsp:Transcript_41154/g.74348  ORF Transcript_41154/g.74348 Transcript_41154/m.74348 type:complete len:547 (-) Transcript_41154:24-1664(-)
MAAEEIVLIVSAALALGLGWAIGANDAANALGAAFGAGTLSVRRGVQIAAVAEFIGAATLGSQVAATLATKVLSQCQINAALEGCSNAGPFAVAPKLVANDRWATTNCASLCGAALFLVLATKFGLPASSTHSAIAALVGSGLLASAGGAKEIRLNTVEWEQVLHIVEAWVLSPCLGCCIAFLMHLWVRFAAYRDAAESTDGVGYWLGPLASSSVALVCTALFAELLHQRHLVGWAVVPIAATSVAIMVHFAVAVCLAIAPDLWVRWNRSLHSWSAGQVDDALMSRSLKESEPAREEPIVGRRPSVLGKEAIELKIKSTAVEKEDAEPQAEAVAPGDSEIGAADELQADGRMSDADAILVAPILSLAALMCVAHGSNDVANALGPLVAVLAAYGHGSADGGPWWSSALVGAGILGGVAVQGYRVMQTVGNGIARLNVKSSFSCQLSTVSTVLIASWLGLPVSTTHVLIGALCGVAGADTLVRSKPSASKSTSSQTAEEPPGDGGMRSGGKKMLLKIAMCWVLTLPLAASIAACAFLAGGSLLVHFV